MATAKYPYEVIDINIINECMLINTDMVIHPKTFKVCSQCSTDPQNKRWRECVRTIDRDYITVMNGSQRPRLHNLIAKAFIPNPNNYKFVKHKDGNNKNNSIDNLFWSKCSNPVGNPKNLIKDFDDIKRDEKGSIKSKFTKILIANKREIEAEDKLDTMLNDIRSKKIQQTKPEITFIKKVDDKQIKTKNFCELCDCDVSNRYCAHKQ
jgi:hypothetical protein